MGRWCGGPVLYIEPTTLGRRQSIGSDKPKQGPKATVTVTVKRNESSSFPKHRPRTARLAFVQYFRFPRTFRTMPCSALPPAVPNPTPAVYRAGMELRGATIEEQGVQVVPE
jgi:hypothetical protein